MLESGDISLFVYHVCLGAYADKSAHCVEHVDEKEGEHDCKHVKRPYLVKLELAEDRLDRLRMREDALEFCDSQRDTDDHGQDYAQKDRTRNFLDIKEAGQDDADEGKEG